MVVSCVSKQCLAIRTCISPPPPPPPQNKHACTELHTSSHSSKCSTKNKPFQICTLVAHILVEELLMAGGADLGGFSCWSLQEKGEELWICVGTCLFLLFWGGPLLPWEGLLWVGLELGEMDGHGSCHGIAARHAVLLEHGCEKTHNDWFRGKIQEAGRDLDAFGWASIQLDGGIEKVSQWKPRHTDVGAHQTPGECIPPFPKGHRGWHCPRPMVWKPWLPNCIWKIPCQAGDEMMIEKGREAPTHEVKL